MRTTRLRLAMSVGFTACLFAPMVQQWTGVPHVQQLAGSELNVESPCWTLKSWFDGTYQRAAEDYLGQRVGFRSWFIKTHNQIHYSLFGIVNSQGGSTVLRGRDGWLYEKAYIDALEQPGRTPPEQAEALAMKLRKLQDLLARRGMGFVLVISPSKAEVYPEYLPGPTVAERRAAGALDYEQAVALFRKYGVAFVDAHARLIDMKNRVPYPLFAKSGSHWNYYAIYLLWADIRRSLEPHMRRTFPGLTCAAVDLRGPVNNDNDLGTLLNIWTWRAVQAPTPYPRLRVFPPSSASLPALLVVGTSFSRRLNDVLVGCYQGEATLDPQVARLCEHVDLLYYYRTLISYPGEARSLFDPSKAAWERVFLDKDAVIIEANETAPLTGGWGFVDDAIRVLENNPAN